MDYTDRIIVGDCLDVLNAMPPGTVDLVLTDPPFNQGVAYAGYDDARPAADYLEGIRTRLEVVRRVLSPVGSLFVAIGPRYQAELGVLLKGLGFCWRNTVVWHYTFGPAQKKKFTPSWVAIHYVTMDPERFTFNADAVRVPLARKLKDNDRRAHPAGKVPDDVWVLRPQDAEDHFLPDIWPRRSRGSVSGFKT